MKAAWTWSEPSPQGNALASAARSSNGSITIAVGDYGTVVRKSGSGTWESLPPIAEGVALSAAVWSGTKFLVTGPEAGLWESTDGLVWTLRDAAVKGDFLFALENTVVCLAADTAWTSAGGAPFQQYSLKDQALSPYRTAALSAGTLVIVRNDGSVASTPNGIDWTSPIVRADTFFYTVAGGPTGFLFGAIDRTGGNAKALLVQFNNSGETEDIPLPSNADFRYYRIFGSATGWLFQDYLTGSLFRRGSTTWNAIAAATPIFYPNATLMVSGNSTLLAGERGRVAMLDSEAVLSVETASHFVSDFLYYPRFTAAALDDVAVAIDKNATRPAQYRYYSTSNGTTWSQTTPAPIAGVSSLGIHSGNIVGYCVANPSTSEGFYRLVGSQWQPFGSSPPTEGTVLSFASNNDSSTVIAIARQETFDLSGNYSAARALYYSPNWSDWTPLALPEARLDQPPSEDVIESVQWDGARFVLLLHPGRIFTSTDGLSWNQLPALPADSTAQLAVAYPGLKLPAANTAVSVSSDGQTLLARSAKLLANGTYSSSLPVGSETFFVFEQGRWWPVPVSTPVGQSRRLLTRDASRFLAIGDGEILSSADGFSWQSHPVRADVSALQWTGSRLLAFTDAFGILSHQGALGEGISISTIACSPRISTLTASVQSYSLTFSAPPSQAWSVGKLPDWISISPAAGSGNATLSVTIKENTTRTPRGAVVSLGGVSHLVSQKTAVFTDSLSVGALQSSLSIPFTGDWSASPSSSLVQFPKNSYAGKGNIRFTLPTNKSSNSRTFTVNVNGIDYTVTQQGQDPAILRVGGYAGVVGFVAEGYLPDSLDSYESFTGSMQLTFAKPSTSLPNGAYTASLSVFHGNQTVQFKSKGALETGGVLTNSTWTNSGKSPVSAQISLQITNDFALNQFASGNITIDSQAYGFFAGKQVFQSKTNPLSAADSGKATFFLTGFGSEGISADTGVAAIDIAPAGTARFAGQLADGSKLTGSFPVLGAAGADNVIPFAFSGSRDKSLISGYARRTVSRETFDWSGPASWPAPARSTKELTASLARYTPPVKGGSALAWTAPANISITSDSFDLIQGNATFSPPSRLTAAIQAPGRILSLKLNPANGMLTGSLSEPNSKKVAMTFLGAVNQSYESLSSGSGSILGFSTTGSNGTLSITPE